MPRLARPTLERADHSAHRAERGCRPHHRTGNRRRRLSRQAVQSARADRAGARRAPPPRRGIAAGERGEDLPLRGLHRRSANAARDRSAWRRHRVDRRGVRSAQDVSRAARPRVVARPAARSHPRPRRRRARSLDRRSGQPASPQARRRRHRSTVQDGAQRRLSARRQGRGPGHARHEHVAGQNRPAHGGRHRLGGGLADGGAVLPAGTA